MSVMSYNGAAIIGAFYFYAHVCVKERKRSSLRDLIFSFFPQNFSARAFDAPLSVSMRR